MNILRLFVFASASVVLPVVSAEEKPGTGSAQVTLVRTKLPSGEKLDEVTTTSAIINDGRKVEGTLAFNAGTADRPKYWTVEFDDEGEGVIYLSVSDTSLFRQGVSEGASWTSPVELFQVTAPFKGSGTVTVYRTKTESLTLEITPVAGSSKEKPEAE